MVYSVVYGSMIVFYSVGEGRGCVGDVVATIANIIRVDSTPCNLVVTSCYLL